MKKSTHKFKKKYLLFFIIPILIISIVAAIWLIKLNSQIKRPEKGKKVTIQTNKEIKKNKKTEKKYLDIALFGLDARDKSLDKGNRSDVVMIAHIDKNKKEIKYFSIYRDSYVNIPDKGWDKLTHAYSYGGYETALSTINTNYDLDITKFVTVNFVALEDTIDKLGGIPIDIQEEEVKWINGYMTSLYKECGLNKVKLISGPGKQNLTGAQAVAYCRIRKTAGGDFKRAERQRTVLNEMFKKAKKTDVSSLLSIIDIISKEIYTNLDTKDIISLAKDISSYSMKKGEGFPYNVKPAAEWCYADSSHKLSVDIATNYLSDLQELHNNILGNKNYKPSSKVKEYANHLAGYQQPTTQAATTTESK